MLQPGTDRVPGNEGSTDPLTDVWRCDPCEPQKGMEEAKKKKRLMTLKLEKLIWAYYAQEEYSLMHNLCKLIKLITQISQGFGLFFLWSINAPSSFFFPPKFSLLVWTTNPHASCGS